MVRPHDDDLHADLAIRLSTLEAELAEVQRALEMREEPIRAPVHVKERAVVVAREWENDLRHQITALEQAGQALDQPPESLSTQVPRAARLCLCVMVILAGFGTLPDGATLAALGTLAVLGAAIAWGLRNG